ncbi:MAG: drug/metabolite exporter YedA [Pseudomonadota bacterium]|nr:drug/metabolite exporter YedA [Pseudomonadota bacterium]
MTAPATPRLLAIASALLAVYVIWGSTYLAIHFALQGGFSPFLLGGMRFLLAGGLMFAVLRWRGVAAPTGAQWRNLWVMGGLLLALGNGMVNYAEQTVSSGLTAVAVASSAIWMGVFALLRGERPSHMEWLGVAVGFAGVMWLNIGGMRGGSAAGLLALLLAALAWAYGSVWSRGRDLPTPFMAAAGQMLCGSVLMLGVGLVSGERMSMPDGKGMAAFLYLLFFGSIVGFSAYIWLLHHVRPVLAGSYAYVNPAIAVMLGAWLANERASATELGAMAVILAGVVVITLGKAIQRH